MIHFAVMAISLCGLMLATAASADEIWVDLAYNLGGENGTEQSPFNSVGEALAAAAPGDTIMIKQGDSTVAVSYETLPPISGVTIAAASRSVTLGAASDELGIVPLPNPTVLIDGDGSLTCLVTGGIPSSYQWLRSEDGEVYDVISSGSDTLVFENETETSLTHHYYYCQVTDDNGDPIESNTFDPYPSGMWRFWSPTSKAEFQTNTGPPSIHRVYGAIETNSSVLVPASYTSAQLVFPSVVPYDDGNVTGDKLELRLSWDDGAANSSCTFTLNISAQNQECDAHIEFYGTNNEGYKATLDLTDNDSWQMGAVEGFYTRGFKLEFLTGSSFNTVSGTLESINLLHQGPTSVWPSPRGSRSRSIMKLSSSRTRTTTRLAIPCSSTRWSITSVAKRTPTSMPRPARFSTPCAPLIVTAIPALMRISLPATRPRAITWL
jgi:hypothetical protein